METLPAFLGSQLTRAPIYIVWLVAIVFALVRWSQHPRVSLIAILAIVSLWVVTAGAIFVNLWLPWSLRARGMTMAEVGQIAAIVSIVSSLLQATCWAGIVVAMFGWRSRAAVALPVHGA